MDISHVGSGGFSHSLLFPDNVPNLPGVDYITKQSERGDVYRVWIIDPKTSWDRAVANGNKQRLIALLQTATPTLDENPTSRVFHLFVKSDNEFQKETWMKYLMEEGGCDHVPYLQRNERSLSCLLPEEPLHFRRWVACVDRFKIQDYRDRKCALQFSPAKYLTKDGIKHVDPDVMSVIDGFLNEARQMRWNVTVVPSQSKQPNPWNFEELAYMRVYGNYKPSRSLIIDYHVFDGKTSGACALVTRRACAMTEEYINNGDESNRPRGVILDCDTGDKETRSDFRNCGPSRALSHGRLQATSDQIGYPNLALLQEWCPGMQTSGGGMWWFLHLRASNKEFESFVQSKSRDPFVRCIQPDQHLDILGAPPHAEASPKVFCLHDATKIRQKRKFINQTPNSNFMNNLILLDADGSLTWLSSYFSIISTRGDLIGDCYETNHWINNDQYYAHNWRLLKLNSTVMRTMFLSSTLAKGRLRQLKDVQQQVANVCEGEELCLVTMCARENPKDRFFAYVTQEFYQNLVFEGLSYNSKGTVSADWKRLMTHLSQWYGLGNADREKFTSDLGIELHKGVGPNDYRTGLFFDLDDMPPLYFRSPHRIARGVANLIEFATWKVLAEGKSDFEIMGSTKSTCDVDHLNIKACEAFSPPTTNMEKRFNMHVVIRLCAMDGTVVGFYDETVAVEFHKRILKEFDHSITSFNPILSNWIDVKHSKAIFATCDFTQSSESTDQENVAQLNFLPQEICSSVACRKDPHDDLFVYTLAVNQVYAISERSKNADRKKSCGKTKNTTLNIAFYHNFDHERVHYRTPAVVPEQLQENGAFYFNIQHCCALYLQITSSSGSSGLVKCEFVNFECYSYSQCQCHTSLTYDVVTMETLSYLSRRTYCDDHQGKNTHVRASSFCHLQDPSGVNPKRLYISNDPQEFARNSVVFLCGAKDNIQLLAAKGTNLLDEESGKCRLDAKTIGRTNKNGLFVLNTQADVGENVDDDMCHKYIKWAPLTYTTQCNVGFLFQCGNAGALARHAMQKHIYDLLQKRNVVESEAKTRSKILTQNWNFKTAKAQVYEAVSFVAYRLTIAMKENTKKSTRTSHTYYCYIKALRTAQKAPFVFENERYVHKTGGGPYCTFIFVLNRRTGKIDHAQLHLGCWNSKCAESVAFANRKGSIASMSSFYF